MENNKKKIELHSEAVQEILGSPPRWLIRSGITVIFAVIVCLFAGSYFIKYPDILKDTIMIDVKNDSDDVAYIGKIVLPRQGAGKVKAGQRVNLKFEEYPYMEYGFAQITLTDVSMSPYMDSDVGMAYIFEVVLPDSLLTQYKKVIPYHADMCGTAEIITNDLSLLDRFISPIKAVIIR